MPTSRNPLYHRHRFPPEVISYAVWLYFRFPLSLRMVEEMPAARGICVTYETVRQWGKKFGEAFADQICQRAPARGDKWHMDEVVVSIAGEQHWLWRAVDQDGFVLDVLVQRRRDSHAAQRLIGRLLKSAVTPPLVMITDKLRSYGAARVDDAVGGTAITARVLRAARKLGEGVGIVTWPSSGRRKGLPISAGFPANCSTSNERRRLRTAA